MRHRNLSRQLRCRQLVLHAALLITGVALSEAATMPTAPLPQRKEQRGVTVSVEFIDAESSQDIFGVDLLKRRVQPILLKITNDSPRAYGFSKAGVAGQVLSAVQVARFAYPNVIGSTMRWSGYTATVVPRTLFDRKVPKRPLLPGDVRKDFAKEEIADGPIPPKTTRSGFVFVPAPLPDGPLRVPLTGEGDSAPLVFEFAAD